MLGALPFPVPLWDKQLGSYSEPPLFVQSAYRVSNRRDGARLHFR
jgi:hypothetical protein